MILKMNIYIIININYIYYKCIFYIYILDYWKLLYNIQEALPRRMQPTVLPSYGTYDPQQPEGMITIMVQ